MTHHPGFLLDILEHPDDDTPRLVYSDWLEENGETERAEFIRVQVELAKTPRWVYSECKACSATPDAEDSEIRHGKGCYTQSEEGGGSEWARESPARDRLVQRERWFFENIALGTLLGFSAPLPLLESINRNRPGHGLRRGFVEHVMCTAAAWLEHGDEILATNPVQEVTLTTWPEVWRYAGEDPGGRFLELRLYLPGRRHGTRHAASTPLGQMVSNERQFIDASLRTHWPWVRKWNLPTIPCFDWAEA